MNKRPNDPDLCAIVIREIREARTNQGYSQWKLAKIAQLSSHTVGMIEAGINLPNCMTLFRLAKVLGLDLNAIANEYLFEPVMTAKKRRSNQPKPPPPEKLYSVEERNSIRAFLDQYHASQAKEVTQILRRMR
jgi:DNA-binding XRE family transcriptional regulator